MKTITKSSLLNYEKLYNLIIFAITFCFLYIGINFFLPIANFLSLFALSLSIFYFIAYLFTKNRTHLIISLSTTLISIGLSLAFYYL